MLKIKKGLVNIIENSNHEPEEALPQPPHPQIQMPAVQPQPPQHVQPQTVQAPAVQPPAPAPRQAGEQMGWEEHLIQALAKAPDDVALKLAACIDREVLMKVLERRNDPFLKVALLLLAKK